jgi:hypothetical protein
MSTREASTILRERRRNLRDYAVRARSSLEQRTPRHHAPVAAVAGAVSDEPASAQRCSRWR